jgi:anti-anti-sigma factor
MDDDGSEIWHNCRVIVDLALPYQWWQELMSHLMSQKNRDVLIVYVNQPKLLDRGIINEVSQELMGMVDRAEKHMLLVNFQHVRFMSSAMLGNLVLLHKDCKKKKINLKMSNVHKDIAELFKIAGMDKLFKIYRDENGAMLAFEKDGWGV